ncbi:MAG: T9SS type A sorting domain-containing protein, partial [Flavobacteriales bacterium]
HAYVWYAGEAVLENEHGASIEVTEPGDYLVQVTGSEGCVAISDVQTIAMVDVPEALLLPEEGATICAGQTVALEVISAQGIAYTWYLNGEELEAISEAIIEVSTGGEYSVLVTDEYGCEALSASTLVQSIEVATPVITDGGTTGEGQLLIADNASGHQWYFNGEMIAGATSTEYLATEDGVYTVLSIEDVCESMLSAGYEVVLGEVSSLNTRSLLVYPNPCADRLNIVLGVQAGRAYWIYDGTGRMVFSATATNERMVVDVHGWSAGVYTLVSERGERVLVEVVR